jgi:hypothetical protein
MAQRAKSKARAPESVHLSMTIEEHQTHYAFGQRFPANRPGPVLNELVSVNTWGTVVRTMEK